MDRVKASNNDVEGRLLEFGGREYMVRGRGYIKSVEDIQSIVVGSKAGTPVLLRDIAEVVLGPDIRRGIVELDGRGEVAGGIVVMRFGENALNVIDGRQGQDPGDRARACRRGSRSFPPTTVRS